jgi:hypothetical protein
VSSSTGKTSAADTQVSFGFGVWFLAVQMFTCALLSGAVRIA